MIESKDFWQYLCEELNYRFFAGVPCIGLKPLYDKMDSRIMHYVPAIGEKTSLGLVSGAFLSGLKGGILISMESIHNVLGSLCSFNLEYRVPLLIIVYGEDKICDKILSTYKLPRRKLSENFKKDLNYIISKSEKGNIPGVIIIGKGVLE